MHHQNEVFSEKVNVGKKTYFFNVKENTRGELYLVINESTRSGDAYKRQRVFVFKEALTPFLEGLNKAVDYIKEHSPQND